MKRMRKRKKTSVDGGWNCHRRVLGEEDGPPQDCLEINLIIFNMFMFLCLAFSVLYVLFGFFFPSFFSFLCEFNLVFSVHFNFFFVCVQPGTAGFGSVAECYGNVHIPAY